MTATQTARIPATANTPAPERVTRLLLAWAGGEPAALERLIPIVHHELRRLARQHMRGERADHMLQTTALINEAYVRLVDIRRVRWQDRAHFFAIASRLMRRVLVDYARARACQKRGGAARTLPLDESLDIGVDRSRDFVALDAALTALEAVDRRKSQVIEMRFFGGLTVEETAAVLAVSADTVMRDWRLAKAWLLRELKAERQS